MARKAISKKLRFEVFKRFLDRLPYEEVRSAAESACGRFGVSTRAFRYFCGICWAKIREGA